MGSPNPEIVNADFAELADEQRQDYTIRKEILWESEHVSEAELPANVLTGALILGGCSEICVNVNPAYS